MTAVLALRDAAFLHALREVDAVRDDLRREQQSLSHDVRALMLGGWTGPAAQLYGEGWVEWETGCRRVLDGLSEMSGAMAWAASRLQRCDGAQGAGLGGIAVRLGEPG